ncbi:unnamed protein product [Plutella xylostella]|uniref:(diamondback moth) hypothetical protein n=1 Tax=Plutella xylostella TaxID=51655 RepID=A0A8S4GAG2_PLUXY|nr:unnamed protein product [Plutella xylostella]
MSRQKWPGGDVSELVQGEVDAAWAQAAVPPRPPRRSHDTAAQDIALSYLRTMQTLACNSQWPVLAPTFEGLQ